MTSLQQRTPAPGTLPTPAPPRRRRRLHPLDFWVARDGTPMLGDWDLYEGHLEALLTDLAAHRSTRADLLVTLNVDHVVKLSGDQTFRDAYAGARWRTVDGMPVRWLLRVLGARRTRRITGAELLPALCASPGFRGRRVVLLGGRDDDLAAARRRLGASCPDVAVLAVPVPLIRTPAETPRSVLDALAAARPDVVFVCLGAPKQELWVHHWRDALPPAVYVGAGAAVAFVAGSERRAPAWMQTAGLEWLFRLSQDPARLLRRYTTEALPIVPIALRSLVPGRLQRRRDPQPDTQPGTQPHTHRHAQREHP